MGLADPSLKLGLEEGFTKATSVTASEVYQFKISTMRRTIKQHFEDFFKQILTKLGYEGEKAVIQMNFGPEETATYNIADIFAAVDRSILSLEGARLLLTKYHKWDIDLEKVKKEVKEDQKVKMEMEQQTKPMNLPLKPNETPEQLTKEVGAGAQGSEAEVYEAVFAPFTTQEPKIVITELNSGLAGMSKDGSTIYIDPIVEVSSYPIELLKAHEMYEYPLRVKLGMPYEKAHKLATIHEKALSDKKGYNWDKLQELYLSLLPIIKARNSKGPDDIL